MQPLVLDTIWFIPCYSLLGGLLSVLWFPAITRKTGPRPAGYANALLTFASFAHGLLALAAIWGQPPYRQAIAWLQVAGLDLTLPLQVSTLSVAAIVLVTGLNLLAQIYAIGYMEMDWGWARFFFLLGAFEAGMCLLVLCDSLFFSYILLEILTLGTYLLIGYWFNQPLVVTGARDAFLTKRVGDLFLLMGVVALLPLTGTWDFTELARWAQAAQVDPSVVTLVGLALLAGPMGKCAQFPLHLWLDEAMEGPIPSTILRNAVVVATGAWVLVKLEPVLALSPVVMAATVFVGAATALGATAIAIAQIDAKRVLSYSTSAYMGLAFVAVGLQRTDLALVLLLTYAVAIALLVMASGAVIWNSTTQDLTQLGGLWSRRPVSGLAFAIGGIALVGLPPLGGFWSFVPLVEAAIAADRAWLAGVLLLVNGLTAFSLTRAFGSIFAGKPQPMTERSPEVHWPMALPMVFLAGIALHLPLLLRVWGLLPHVDLLLSPLGLAAAGSAILGIAAGVSLYFKRDRRAVRLPVTALQEFFARDFYTATLYERSIVGGVALISRLANWFDRHLVDGAGNLMGLATLLGGQSLRYSTSGTSQIYLLTIAVGIVALIAVVVWR